MDKIHISYPYFGTIAPDGKCPLVNSSVYVNREVTDFALSKIIIPPRLRSMPIFLINVTSPATRGDMQINAPGTTSFTLQLRQHALISKPPRTADKFIVKMRRFIDDTGSTGGGGA
jgi:hypothetical protein